MERRGAQKGDDKHHSQPEGRRIEVLQLYAPDDVHEHDVDVTGWASRGVAEAVPLDACTPRAMPPRACCVLGLCLYRGSA